MPNLDGFRQVLFNAGEQAVVADWTAMQRQIQMSILEMFGYGGVTNATQQGSGTNPNLEPEQADWALGADSTTVPTDVAFCPFPAAGYAAPGTGANTIVIKSPGPIVQVLGTTVGAPAEGTPTIAAYWMHVGEFTLTTAVGDATNPRIDMVEMKLEYVDASPETRVYNQPATQATLALAGLTSHVDTTVRARAGGKGGNNISIAFVADGTGAGSLTANGNALTFHYQTAVTTVANFESALLISDLMEVGSAGTGAHVFTSPGDTLTTTHLTGGANSVLVGSSSLNKAHRVQATFQIKQGTPAALPGTSYPARSTGFVPICAVYVPAAHNGVHTLSNFRDMRWPLGGVQVYDVDFHDFNWGNGPSWAISYSAWRIQSASAGTVHAAIPTGSSIGRLVGVAAFGGWSGATQFSRLMRLRHDGADPVTYTELANMDTRIAQQLASFEQLALANALTMMDDIDTTQLYPGKRVPNTRVGTGMWTNCSPAGPALFAGFGVPGDHHVVLDKLALEMQNAGSGCHLAMVRFYVAHGMR